MLQDAGFHGIQIAFYDENLGDAELNALGELIANNRGASLQIFQSLKAAQRWIEQPG